VVNQVYLKDYSDKNPHLVFVIKKTERILGALYLITDLLKETEPIRQTIRSVGISFLSLTLRLRTDGSKRAVHEALLGLGEVKTHLSAAYHAGYVSDMNHHIMLEECERLCSFIKMHADEIVCHGHKEAEITPSFFDVKDIATEALFGNGGTSETLPEKTSRHLLKGHDLYKKKTESYLEIGRKRQIKTLDSIAKRNKRRETILELLRNKQKLTIKDVIGVISDCSEKTIQRELMTLVNDGVLKKEGERRWSTYSVA